MSRLSPEASEAGVSLVEVLVAVVLLGSAVLALVGGLGSVVSSSDRHRRTATADTVARSYTEALKLTVSTRPAATWCSPSAYNVSANYTVPAGYTVSQVPGACPAAGAAQIQTVVIEAADALSNPRGVARIVATVRQP